MSSSTRLSGPFIPNSNQTSGRISESCVYRRTDGDLKMTSSRSSRLRGGTSSCMVTAASLPDRRVGGRGLRRGLAPLTASAPVLRRRAVRQVSKSVLLGLDGLEVLDDEASGLGRKRVWRLNQIQEVADE